MQGNIFCDGSSGLIFIVWKRVQTSEPLTEQDLVFCNPKAEDDYTVTLYSRCIRGIRDELGLNPDFILYSTRSCFVNEGDLQGRKQVT